MSRPLKDSAGRHVEAERERWLARRREVVRECVRRYRARQKAALQKQYATEPVTP